MEYQNTNTAAMQLTKSIELAEGRVPYVYQDSEGILTLGVGCNVDKDHGGGLFPEEIDYIFKNRLNRAIEQSNRQFPWTVTLNDPRKNVIYEMMFQLGLGKLLQFKNFLQAAQRGDWAAAGDEMLDSKWAKQTPKRVARLVKQMVSGAYVETK
jgi:lysozyme